MQVYWYSVRRALGKEFHYCMNTPVSDAKMDLQALFLFEGQDKGLNYSDCHSCSKW